MNVAPIYFQVSFLKRSIIAPSVADRSPSSSSSSSSGVSDPVLLTFGNNVYTNDVRCDQSLHGCVQGSTKRWSPGLVNFVSSLAYHFCLNLLAAFMQAEA